VEARAAEAKAAAYQFRSEAFRTFPAIGSWDRHPELAMERGLQLRRHGKVA